MDPVIQPPKGPESIAWITYAWVIWISTAGGIVAFMRKLLKRRTREFSIVEFVGECTTSAFAGVISFWLCQWAQKTLNLDPILTPAIVGLSGHMGSRSISIMETWLTQKFPKIED